MCSNVYNDTRDSEGCKFIKKTKNLNTVTLV